MEQLEFPKYLVWEILLKFKYIHSEEMRELGNSLVVQWLGLHAFTAKGMGSIPSQGTKIPQATWCGQNFKKTKKERNEGTVYWDSFSNFIIAH